MRRHLIRLVFFAPYPSNEAPSQRFRYEQYLELLEGKGFKITLFSFYSQSAWKKLYTKPAFWQFLQLVRGFFISFSRIPYASTADYIFIHREVAPVGPPITEWLLAKVLRKKIIYDFDDAIWLTDKTDEPKLEKIIRWRSKVASICRWSYKVSCGNTYLADYAAQFNNCVVINPTTIDTSKTHNKELKKKTLTGRKNAKKSGDKITIGWTGSRSTLKYLELLTPALEEIGRKYSFVSYLVIADQAPQLTIQNLKFRQWSQATEIEDLSAADIGIMPLPDDAWTRGKCGFKALQYMALEIPAVVSPVGVNTSIVTPGVHGFWCNSEEEWVEALSRLIEDETLRKKMGMAGREKVINHYSVQSNSNNFYSLFS